MRCMAATERVNLNLPAEARARLRRLAKASKKSEAAYVRDLVLDAVAREERAELQRRLEARSPKARARELEIASALERWRGSAR